MAEEGEYRRRVEGESERRREEEELARRAEEARRRRVEEEEAARRAEAEADRDLLASVPTLGGDGVREQIGRMRASLSGTEDGRASLAVALGSLHELFDQIVRRPEESNFRRVRRDHPQFVRDIGRHAGGREVLIAAGFSLERVDGVPCFLSREPHIESDMDGWSEWFDRLKKTLEVIEEEMMK